jgi:hydroxymethylbilane synthase
VCNVLRAAVTGLEIETIAMETTGDRIRDRPLRECGGKGLFVKELDEALLEGRIDFAVHSLKDVPSELPPGIALASVPPRADARDALVSLAGHDLATLPDGARVGTSSPRRAAQLLAVAPRVRIEPLRGNVDSRLRKIVACELDATLLAVAGLGRLGVDPAPARAPALDADIFVPAPCQGALGLTVREDDHAAAKLLRVIEDPTSRAAADAERSAARALGGSCWLPVGVHAHVVAKRLRLVTFLFSADGRRTVRREAEDDARNAEALGRRVAEDVLAAGGREIVASLPGPA